MTKTLSRSLPFFFFLWSTIQGTYASHCGSLFGSGIEGLVERGTVLTFEFETGLGRHSFEYEFDGIVNIDGREAIRWWKTNSNGHLVLIHVFSDSRGIWEIGLQGTVTPILEFGEGVSKVEQATRSVDPGGLVGGLEYRDGKLRHDVERIKGSGGQAVGGDLHVRIGADGKKTYFLSSFGLVQGYGVHLKEVRKGNPLY